MKNLTEVQGKETEKLSEKITYLKEFINGISDEITNIISLEAQQIELNVLKKHKLRYIKSETEKEIEENENKIAEILADKID